MSRLVTTNGSHPRLNRCRGSHQFAADPRAGTWACRVRVVASNTQTGPGSCRTSAAWLFGEKSQRGVARVLPKDWDVITRRGLLQSAAAAWASGRVWLENSREAVRGRTRADNAEHSAPAAAKIALEEHFVIPETFAASYGAPGGPEFQRRLLDIGSARIAEMDRGGVDVCVLSLVGDESRRFRMSPRLFASPAEPTTTSPSRLPRTRRASRDSLRCRSRTRKQPLRS